MGSQHQGASSLASVIDQDFVFACGNPFEESLSKGQFVIWKLT